MTGAQAARVEEASEILRALRFDAGRSNERSALVLLALLDLRPRSSWTNASASLMRIVDIMQWLRDHYAQDYAPNSRETIRRQTLHQFVDAGLVVRNPDDPRRPVNSGKTCYEIAPAALTLSRSYGKPRFARDTTAYLEDAPGLRDQYTKARHLAQIPVSLLDGSTVTLTPGGQNVLLKEMVETFCPRWTAGGEVLYIGDAGKADPVYEVDRLGRLGIVLDKHGKLPDLIVHLPECQWLVLMEAASSHGPVDAKRHHELEELFGSSTAGLVYVSCFPSRAEMRRYLADIAWETEVWCADDPDHLIHFNGERFLGPYGLPRA